MHGRMLLLGEVCLNGVRAISKKWEHVGIKEVVKPCSHHPRVALAQVRVQIPQPGPRALVESGRIDAASSPPCQLLP